MTYHHAHLHEAHRRVYPGAAHQEEKRDEPIVMEERDGDPGVATVYSVVYVTASQDFPGDVASYSTPPVEASTTATSAPTTSQSPTSATSYSMNAEQSAYNAAKSSAANYRASSHSSSTTAVESTATAIPVAASSIETSSVAIDTSSFSTTSFLTSTTSSSEPASSTSSVDSSVANALGDGSPQATGESSINEHSSQAIQQTSSGLSGGQQAGLAIGIIAAFAIAAGLLFFCWRKRKAFRRSQQGGEQLNEKHGSFFGSNQPMPNGMGSKRSSDSSDRVPASVRTTRTASVAPRLSLRPVTQFLPNLMAAGDRKSTGNTLNIATEPVSEKTSAWERKPSQVADNPFADAAVLSEKAARPASAESNDSKNPFEEPVQKATVRPASPTSSNGKEESVQGSPKSVQVGTASTVAVGKSGPPPPTQPNNVHRVQLDFKPSMDDELELRAGQLVRMLHAYDDGWALCIRMDRSQQGVCPRTCLSNLPVKPRNGPPPGSRPPPGMRQPSNPAGPMYPRPLTPNGGPQGNRQRSETDSRPSESSFDNRDGSSADALKPAGAAAGMPARKPVPGQAL